MIFCLFFFGHFLVIWYSKLYVSRAKIAQFRAILFIWGLCKKYLNTDAKELINCRDVTPCGVIDRDSCFRGICHSIHQGRQRQIQQVPPKCWYPSTGLHNVTPQNTLHVQRCENLKFHVKYLYMSTCSNTLLIGDWNSESSPLQWLHLQHWWPHENHVVNSNKDEFQHLIRLYS
jgi:hypothetical protein